MITVDLASLSPAPGCRIADIGCGSGRHTCLALRFPGVVAVGLDKNPADLSAARDRIAFLAAVGEHGGGDCLLLAGDAARLPLAAASFDIVVCSEVLEHVPDVRSVVRELLRIVRPGGVLAVSVPRGWPERICWLLSRRYSREEGGHVRIFDARDLRRRIERSGAAFFRTHFAHALHAPYWWLKCLPAPERFKVPFIEAWRRLLVWDMMQKPRFTRTLERLLNPVLGKSVVLYFRKNG